MEGSQDIPFHECSITGYTFARHLSKTQLLDLSEFVPEGDSTQKLIEITGKYDSTILAGLFEKDNNDSVFKAYICVDKTDLLAKYHKLHPFINPHLAPGSSYCVFNIHAGNVVS